MGRWVVYWDRWTAEGSYLDWEKQGRWVTRDNNDGSTPVRIWDNEEFVRRE